MLRYSDIQKNPYLWYLDSSFVRMTGTKDILWFFDLFFIVKSQEFLGFYYASSRSVMSISFVALSIFPVCLSPLARWYFLIASIVVVFIFPSFFPEKNHSSERTDCNRSILLSVCPSFIPESADTEFSAFLYRVSHAVRSSSISWRAFSIDSSSELRIFTSASCAFLSSAFVFGP